MVSSIVGAVLNLAINYVLIPRFQSNGAAIGTIVAEFSVMFIQIVAVQKKLPVLKYIIQYIPVLFTGFAMMLVVREIGVFMGNSIVTLSVQIGVGGLMFYLLILFYFILSKDEMYELIKETIMNKIKR